MEASRFPDSRLVAFARRLQSAENYDTLLREVSDEIREAVGYGTAWIAVIVPEANAFKVLSIQGPGAANLWDVAPLIPLENDVYVQELLNTKKTQIVEDAQLDPRVNREIVAQLGNRTIVNVPLLLIDEPFGALGTGSFFDEGTHVPTDEEVEYLEKIASQVVVASARILLAIEREESRKQQIELDALLARRQRLESLGQLAGGVAHDFNNLLTVIRASAQMLRDDVKDPVQSENLKLIERAAVSASELTGRLLALGKRQRLDVEPIALNKSIDSVLEMFGRVVRASVEIKLEEAEGLPSVLGDAGQLEQVMMNLMINAADAMPDGGTLTVATEPFEITREFIREHPWAAAGEYVLVTISDTGEGISEDHLDHIFEPFFTTKSSAEGSGLGLAVSRGIVEQHGGMINAYSEVGIGTTFKIYLPTSTAPVAEQRLDPVSGDLGGTERVLVADDQDDVRDVIARILARAGYEVVTVRNGAEAVDQATSDSFDLVILDAVMPVMGGNAARVLIAETKPDLPVIFVTGYGGAEMTTRVLGEHNDPVLAKPFDPDTLLRAVRKSLDANNDT